MISSPVESFTIKTSNANLRSVLKPLYIVLSILGLFPYSVQLKTIKPGFRTIPKSIYFNFMCAMFYLIVMFSFLVIHVRYVREASEENALIEAFMTQLNYLIEALNLFIVCITTYICVYLQRFQCLTALNTLSNLIETSNINKENILKNLRFQVNIVVLVSLGFLLLMQISVTVIGNDSLFMMMLITITFILPQMIQFTSIAFFRILILTVAEILRSVEERIPELEPPTEVTTNLPKVTPRQGKLNLYEIKLIYIEAVGVKQVVNKMFEAPILMTMMQCFHGIVSESHIIYHGVVIQMNLTVHEIASCSIWIIYQFLKIYALANAGNSFKLETSKLCRSIYNIPTEKQELRFLMEIQHLAAMVSHSDKELTVFGYFPLDASLMFKMIASVAMYVIILVQFDKEN